jgi:hypothetical protein
VRLRNKSARNASEAILIAARHIPNQRLPRNEINFALTGYHYQVQCHAGGIETMRASAKLDASKHRKRGAKRPRRRGLGFRPLVDAAMAGLVFILVSSAIACTHAKAGIMPMGFTAVAQAAPRPYPTKAVAEQAPLPLVQIATATSPADAVYRHTSQAAAWLLLGVAFSTMAALNLAVIRHLKRAYAAPTKRVSTPRWG